MRRRMLPALTCLWLGALTGAGAQAAAGSKSLYVVAHVDIVGAGGNLEQSIQLLREFVADSGKDPGAVRIELLQQDNRHNHFTIVEVWRNKKAFDAHSAAEHTKQFREKVQPMLGSPFDERLNDLLP